MNISTICSLNKPKTNNGPREISAVGSNANISKWKSIVDTKIVFISFARIKIISEISKKWQNNFQDKNIIYKVKFISKITLL